MLIYYVLLSFVLLVASPILLAAKKRRAGLWQKLGVVPRQVTAHLQGKEKPVWFHAVSVGEFNAVWPLVQLFRARYPQIPVVISTSTKTGNALARQKAGGIAEIVYFPLDLPWAVKGWLDALRPRLVAIAETEIWPGFVHECNKRYIPVCVVNGRISPRSFRTYRSLRAFFGPVIRGFSCIIAQSDADVRRYVDIAGDTISAHSVGNLKFDGLVPTPDGERAMLMEKLNLTARDSVIIAGSTHEGEETSLLQALSRFTQEGLAARLILVPRHPERFERVAQLIQQFGFVVRRYSKSEAFSREGDVFLLDTIGQLFRFYSVGSVAFVGGTLVPVGGHNIVEPCAFALPVVCGPHLAKTQAAANALLARDALVIAGNQRELEDKLRRLLTDRSQALAAGERGRCFLKENQGAVHRTMDLLDQLITLPYNAHGAKLAPAQPAAKDT